MAPKKKSDDAAVRKEEARRQQLLDEVGWYWIRQECQKVKKPPTINTYYRSAQLGDIRERLLAKGGQALLDRFNGSCFGHFMRWPNGQANMKALYMLVSRQVVVAGADEDDIWYQIGGKNIRFSPREFALISGLNFGATSFDPDANKDPRNVLAFQRFCEGGHRSQRDLLMRFEEGDNVEDPDGSLHIQVANVLIATCMIIGRDERNLVEPWLWVLAADLNSWNNFPWGTYAYRGLKRETKLQKNTVAEMNKQKFNWYGSVWALQCWMFEAIPGLAQIVAEKQSDTDTPRCLRWKMVTAKQVPLDDEFADGVPCYETLTPEPEEEMTVYWRSFVGDDVLGVNWRAPRNPIVPGNPGRQPGPRRSAGEGPSVEGPNPAAGHYRYDMTHVGGDRRQTEKHMRRQAGSSSSSGDSFPGAGSGRKNWREEIRGIVRSEIKSAWKNKFLPELKSLLTNLFKKSSRRSGTPPSRHTPPPVGHSSPPPQGAPIPGRHSAPGDFITPDWISSEHGPYSQTRASDAHIAIRAEPLDSRMHEQSTDDIFHNPNAYAAFARQAHGNVDEGSSRVKGKQSIDDTHLKGEYKGILFVAATKDSNEHVVPLAFGIGDVEDSSSWSWFLQHVRQTFGCPNDMLIVSDQHLSIKNAVEEVYDGIPHGLCSFHIQGNLKSCNAAVIDMFKAAANAYRTQDFEEHMQRLKDVSPHTYEKLMRIGPSKWVVSQCPVRKFGFGTSNAVEVLNARLVWARSLPICSLLEVARNVVQDWFYQRRTKAGSRNEVLTQHATNELRATVESGRFMRVEPISDTKFNVIFGTRSNVVDIASRVCSCRVFDLDMIPCSHAAAAIRFKKESPVSYVHPCYLTATWREIYAADVMPIPAKDEWCVPPNVASRVVCAPNDPKQAGRPRKKRISCGTHKRRSRYCQRCGQKGHHVSTCPLIVPEEEVSSKESSVKQARRAKKCGICGVVGHTRVTCKDLHRFA